MNSTPSTAVAIACALVFAGSSAYAYSGENLDNVQPTRRELDPYWVAIRKATSQLEATQPCMLLPSVAEDILIQEKIASLEASGTGAFIARAAMTGEEAKFIVEHLSEFVKDIVHWKIQQDPVKVLETVQRAIDRNTVV